MDSQLSSLILGAAALGLGGGLLLLARGLEGYRRATALGGLSSSPIGSVAIGEVRVSGTVEPSELVLVSPLESRRCVYYRALVHESEGQERHAVLSDARAVGFSIRDPSGTVRVFPRGATWDAPPRLDDGDDLTGAAPPGLSPRLGPGIEPANPDRAELVARLLTVQPALDGSDGSLARLAGRGRCHYEETTIEPGDIVTIVGRILPFDQLDDALGADLSDASTAVGGPLAATTDPEIAADLAAARAAGTLETDPEEAWGNAAIPGFGIGQPVRAPVLDPAARPLPIADEPTAARFERTFEIAPEALVLAATPDHPLLISLGAPAVAVARGQDRFLLGLVGAVMAIASAVVLALELGGIAR